MRVYPNPASDQLVVMLDNEAAQRIELLDATGRLAGPTPEHRTGHAGRAGPARRHHTCCVRCCAMGSMLQERVAIARRSGPTVMNGEKSIAMGAAGAAAGAIGALTGDIGPWIGVCIALGAGIGLTIGKQARKDSRTLSGNVVSNKAHGRPPRSGRFSLVTGHHERPCRQRSCFSRSSTNTTWWPAAIRTRPVPLHPCTRTSASRNNSPCMPRSSTQAGRVAQVMHRSRAGWERACTGPRLAVAQAGAQGRSPAARPSCPRTRGASTK